MRGIGGPLLCIGDLLSDLADAPDNQQSSSPLSPPACSSPSPSLPYSPQPLRPSDLPQLFEKNYNELINSLKGNDHSWTTLTLKLCTALEIADKLVHVANSNVESLLEKIDVLESILKIGDSVVDKAKALQDMKLSKKVII